MPRKQIFIITLSLFLILIGMYLLFGMGDKYSWQEHYLPESRDPYGTYLIGQLLDGYFPGKEFQIVEDTLNGVLDKGNYVFIGSFLWLDSLQTDALLHFVQSGNQAFIASTLLPPALLDSVMGADCAGFSGPNDSVYFTGKDFLLKDTMVSLQFEHPELVMDSSFSCKFIYRHEAMFYEWTYLPEDIFCEDETAFASLGLMNASLVNFARAEYGKGAFYFHTTPLVFTNYYLAQARGLEYATRTFSHLRPGKIYWDNRQAYMPSYPRNRQLTSEGPLKYILSQPSLSWAWYILLGMAVLYLIFRAKRRQRIIPVLPENTNTSLEFIGTIGRLFFLQNNHKQLALQKMKLFLGFVRERYHLPTRELNEPFIEMLSTRAEIPAEVIDKIIRLHRNISSSGYVSENVLVNFHGMVESFYRQCK